MISLCHSRLRLLIAAASLIFLQACATSSSIEEARWQFFSGQPALALQTLETGETSPRDQLLKYLEAGMIAHSAGLYEDSSRELIRAAALIEDYDAIRVGEQTASLITNDWLLSYKGEYSERLWVHTIQMMNFLLLGDAESAAVEARQALQQYDLHPEPLEHDWFTRTLIALSFEAAGKYDSAHIEYKKLFDIPEYTLGWAQAAINNAKRLGRSEDVKALESAYSQSGERIILNAVKQNGNLGELILFVQNGIIQEKYSSSILVSNDLRASFPAYEDYPIDRVQVSVRAENALLGIDTTTTTMVDVARQSLEARAASLTTKQIARIAAKHKIGELASEEDELLGAFITAILFITEEADTRSWQTLPQQMTLVRIPLSEGTHSNIVVTVDDGLRDHVLKIPTVTIREGRRHFARLRVGRGSSTEESENSEPAQL